MAKNKICKLCGVGFRKNQGKGKLCPTCRPLKHGKVSRCRPECLPGSLGSRLVRFQNGEQHRQQFCSECLYTSYIPLNEGDRPKKERKYPKRPTKIGYVAKVMQRKYGVGFYTSEEWLRLRFKALSFYGKKCMCCSATTGTMHVDHIKPKSKFPLLALEFSNLQVLCEECNRGKGAEFQTDFRDERREISDSLMRVYEL